MKELKITDAVLEKYNSQKNVIRRSGNSRLNYGKIAVCTDADVD